MSNATDTLVGKVIAAGRYEIVRKLGAGGMGAVYQAKQVSMDRLVALKLIHPNVAENPEAAGRFNREMQATAKIEHPNTIRVYDYGQTEEGQLFLAMEFLDGKALSKILEESGPMPLDRIVRIASQVARALGAAHQEGIVHRDLKPDNIMLLDHYERDFVKVLDFGIARFLDEQKSKMTADGAVIGTPTYMSPEQATGGAIDHRSDLYSMGVMLYQMATGQVPFQAPTPLSLLVMHAMEAPKPPAALVPGVVDPTLEALIMQLLSKAPADRIQTAADVAARLEACVGGMSLATQQAAVGVQNTLPDPRLKTPGGSTPALPPSTGGGSKTGVLVGAMAVVALIVAGVLFGPKLLHSGGGGGAGGSAGGDGSSRVQLDALLTADNDPLAPANCQVKDGKTISALASALTEMHGGRPWTPRPQDEQALALLERSQPAVADKPEAAEYFTVLAQARIFSGRAADAVIEAAKRSAALCPDYALTFNLLGNAQQKSGHPEDAETAYNRALAILPTYGAPRFNLGLLALRRKDPATATAVFTALLKFNPKHPNAYFGLGQADLASGRTEDAITHFQEATHRTPERAEAWLLLGQARQLGGHADTAKEAFCKAKELGSPEAVRLCP